MDTVYIETTVVGNIVGRVHPDPVTWNFKHILNPHVQTKIANTCREGGFGPPVICTPQQLLESEDDS
jgi:hypothetical protein